MPACVNNLKVKPGGLLVGDGVGAEYGQTVEFSDAQLIAGIDIINSDKQG